MLPEIIFSYQQKRNCSGSSLCVVPFTVINQQLNAPKTILRLLSARHNITFCATQLVFHDGYCEYRQTRNSFHTIMFSFDRNHDKSTNHDFP